MKLTNIKLQIEIQGREIFDCESNKPAGEEQLLLRVLIQDSRSENPVQITNAISIKPEQVDQVINTFRNIIKVENTN